jgi:hypothetical protein
VASGACEGSFKAIRLRLLPLPSRSVVAGWRRRCDGWWSTGGHKGSLGGCVASAAPPPSSRRKAARTGGATARVVVGTRSCGGVAVEHGGFDGGAAAVCVVGGDGAMGDGAADVCVNGGDGATRVGADGLSLDGDGNVRMVERGWQPWRPCGLDSFPSTSVAAWWPCLFPSMVVVGGGREAPVVVVPTWVPSEAPF